MNGKSARDHQSILIEDDQEGEGLDGLVNATF